MSSITLASINDVLEAETPVNQFVTSPPMIRSHALEHELGLPASRRVWLKDYGSTPTGSFKVMGALGWISKNSQRIGDRPVVASSSGNFASGLAFACERLAKRAIIVMPDNAPQIKFELTRSFGAKVITYDISQDHITGDRERMVREISEHENAVLASPYDDNAVIAGNGVGGLQIIEHLRSQGRQLAAMICPVSGGGLLAGLGLVISCESPSSQIIAVEPEFANDFQQSLAAGQRVSLKQPLSICDGLLSYDVGHHNWPILQRTVSSCETLADCEIVEAMRWLNDHHGLRTEPSGAISIAMLLSKPLNLTGDGDVVAIISGRNVDDDFFQKCLQSNTKSTSA